jgi:hypothetical protein
VLLPSDAHRPEETVPFHRFESSFVNDPLQLGARQRLIGLGPGHVADLFLDDGPSGRRRQVNATWANW